MKATSLLLLFVAGAAISSAQNNLQKIQAFRKDHEKQMIAEYLEFVAIPNETHDTANIQKNAAFISAMLEKRGIHAQLLKPAVGNAAVFGEVKVPGATKTICFYAHYDGQPVNAKQWAAGLKPFEPVFITAPLEHSGTIVPYQPGMPVNPEWRLTGRGSADDKAGVMCIISAYDALVKNGIKPGCNIKFFFEGEEEKGSGHLGEIFHKNKDLLAADLWISCDGPRYFSGQKAILFGVRGDQNMYLTVYGAKRPLHSGNYGNWAPNPGIMLARLLASMKDDNGQVTIKGFYDDVTPLTETEKTAMHNAPDVEPVLKTELGLASGEDKTRSFLEDIMRPTLNINGMASGNVGAQASNVIPAKAEAVLDLRLVPGNDYKRQAQKVVDHIKAQGYYVIDREPADAERYQHDKIIRINYDDGYNAQRTPMDLPIAQLVIKAVQSTVDYPPVLLPSLGGSLPLWVFEKELGTKVITVPLVNYDNNQHAENENVKISYLWEGIDTVAAIMQVK